MSERLTQQIKEEIESRLQNSLKEYIKELDTEHELFMEKYPQLASAFKFYRDLFSKIDKRVENTRVVVEPSAFLVDVSATSITPVFPDRQKITLIKRYADQLEEVGYIRINRKRYTPENIFFHEFLHVLCNYREDLFNYSCGRIDIFPELSVENPPKTSEGILKRIDEMNSLELPEELLL